MFGSDSAIRNAIVACNCRWKKRGKKRANFKGIKRGKKRHAYIVIVAKQGTAASISSLASCFVYEPATMVGTCPFSRVARASNGSTYGGEF